VDGTFFPFSRGTSFYRVDNEGLIVWGIDCVEAPPPKPGDSTLGALKTLLPVLRSIGLSEADPARLTTLPVATGALWAFYAGALGRCLAFLPCKPCEQHRV
jgi:hypothetical protein